MTEANRGDEVVITNQFQTDPSDDRGTITLAATNNDQMSIPSQCLQSHWYKFVKRGNYYYCSDCKSTRTKHKRQHEKGKRPDFKNDPLCKATKEDLLLGLWHDGIAIDEQHICIENDHVQVQRRQQIALKMIKKEEGSTEDEAVVGRKKQKRVAVGSLVDTAEISRGSSKRSRMNRVDLKGAEDAEQPGSSKRAKSLISSEYAEFGKMVTNMLETVHAEKPRAARRLRDEILQNIDRACDL